MIVINNPFTKDLQRAEREDDPDKELIRAKHTAYARTFLNKEVEIDDSKQKTLGGF